MDLYRCEVKLFSPETSCYKEKSGIYLHGLYGQIIDNPQQWNYSKENVYRRNYLNPVTELLVYPPGIMGNHRHAWAVMAPELQDRISDHANWHCRMWHHIFLYGSLDAHTYTQNISFFHTLLWYSESDDFLALSPKINFWPGNEHGSGDNYSRDW